MIFLIRTRVTSYNTNTHWNSLGASRLGYSKEYWFNNNLQNYKILEN